MAEASGEDGGLPGWVTGWGLALLAALFLGYVVWSSVAPVEVRCEVCLEFDGELVCRTGAGPDQESARLAAQESACGGNTGGMAEMMLCRRRPAERVSCGTR